MSPQHVNDNESIATAEQKPCPVCGEFLSATAVKCLDCGETFLLTPKKKSRWLLGCLWGGFALVVGFVLLLFLLPPVRRAREPARRSQCINNLKQIAIALHEYREKHGALPPAYTVDDQGNRLHSWRTLILPFTGYQYHYDQIDLTKPWNDPVNQKAFETTPPVYNCLSSDPRYVGSLSIPRGYTTYLASVGINSCFHPTEPRPFHEISDETSHTLMVLEVPTDRAVPWMSPEDADEELILAIDEKSTTAHPKLFHVAFADGQVRNLSVNTPVKTRRALITINGGETVADY